MQQDRREEEKNGARKRFTEIGEGVSLARPLSDEYDWLTEKGNGKQRQCGAARTDGAQLSDVPAFCNRLCAAAASYPAKDDRRLST